MLHQPFDIQIVDTAEYPLLNPFVLGEVTKGSTIAEGYELSRIVYIDND